MNYEEMCNEIKKELREIKIDLREQSKRIIELEKSRISTDILVKNFTDVSKELSCTMKTVEKTMVGIQVNIKDNTKDISNINYQLTELSKDMQEESDKNKIDMRDINKDKLIDSVKKYGIGAVSIVGLIKVF